MPNGPKPIRLVLVSEVRLYCDGLTMVLPPERLLIAGTASSRPDASVLVRELRPDAILIDIAVPESLDLMRQLRADTPSVHVIAFAVDEDVASVVECAEAGAVAYVPASAGVDELLAIVDGIASNELHCAPRVAGELFRRAGEYGRTRADSETTLALTGREREVLGMLRQSLSNKEIASALRISEATVKNHVHHLLEKLKVSSRVKAAMCLPRPNRTALKSLAPTATRRHENRL